MATNADDKIDRLDVLVGRWEMTASLGGDDGPPPAAEATFEWLEGRRFLVQRWHVDLPEAPDGIAVIGYDDEKATYLQHYFDSRGIARVYEMSLDDDVWRLSRFGSDFSQRFTGRFRDSGNTIAGAWEISNDGQTWEHDFELTYTRVRE